MENDTPRAQTITINGDLYTFSLDDIDTRIAELKAEIARLEEERKRKQGSIAAADAFFKSPG